MSGDNSLFLSVSMILGIELGQTGKLFSSAWRQSETGVKLWSQ